MSNQEPQPLPPYSYVPGAGWPHPIRSPQGHLLCMRRGRVEPMGEQRWEDSHEYLEGIALFNAGYYWEAHDAWEPFWHVHERRGTIADVLKGLIKLAAAGVKVRERRPAGARSHARRAAEALARARSSGGPRRLGLDLGRRVGLA